MCHELYNYKFILRLVFPFPWFITGGAHRIPSGLPEIYHDGFNGCIASITVNNRPLNLTKDRQSHGSAEYCTDL